MASGVNSIALAALEFADAAVDFPIVFVKVASPQGEPEMTPVAVFGLTAGENLYVQGSSWRARYVPAMLRMYPFGVAGIAVALFFDMNRRVRRNRYRTEIRQKLAEEELANLEVAKPERPAPPTKPNRANQESD